MLISIFKSNKPVVLIILPFVAAAMWVFAFISPVSLVTENSMPFYSLFAQLLGEFSFAANCLAILLLVVQSIMLNDIIAKSQILSSHNYLPSLLYVVIMSSCPSLLTLHPVLFANFFLIIAIGRILIVYRQENIFPNVFDAAFLIGIASLFYFPAIALFPFIWIGLTILRPFAWREWVIPLTGLIVPYFFAAVYFFWFDQLGSFWNESIVAPMTDRSNTFLISKSFYFLIGMSLIILFLSFRKLSRGLSINTIRARKLLTVLFWFFIFSLISTLIAPSYSINYFVLTAIPLSVFATSYFLSTRSRLWTEVIFLLLIGAIVYVQVENL